MMSPLKLSVIVCGAAAGLAVAPYLVKQILPPVAGETAAVETPVLAQEHTVSVVKADLPVARPNVDPVIVAVPPALAPTPPAKEELPAQPELNLASAALPTPALVKTQPELGLPSLANPEIAQTGPPPTPRVTPSPTPEIPYRSDVESAQKLMKELGLSTGKIDGKLGPNTKGALAEYQKKNGLPADGEVTEEVLAKMQLSVVALAKATPIPSPEPEAKVVISDSKNDSEPKSNAADMAISSADDPDTLIVRKTSPESDADSKVVVNSTSKKESPAKPVAKRNLNPGPVPTLKNVNDVKKLQTELTESGVYEGNVDGKWGDLTRTAMRAYQEKMSLEVTGKPNKETWLEMNNDMPAANEVADSKKPSKSDSDDTDVASGEKTKIASAAADESDNADVLVTVNGDGASTPEAKKPLPTPKVVTSLSSDSEQPEKKTKPQNSSQTTDSKPGKKDSTPSDLAVANEDRESQAADLKKQIAATKARIESVSKDSTYEVEKYAPKMLDAVNTMAEDLDGDDPGDDTKARLSRIVEELEKAKTESMKNKAEALVDDVRKSYSSLKDNFSDRIKTLSLSDEDEKKQREEITVFVASIDTGFDAMESDLKKGKLEPIFKNGAEFKRTIDDVNSGLAKLYVQEKLDDENTKKKLGKDEISDIESLVNKDQYEKAAETLDKAVASSSKKKS